MSDGRHYTSFDPSCKANRELRDSLGIKNNYQYRQWLINNGKSVAKQNKKLACNETSQCIVEAAQVPSQQKYLFKNCADDSTPYGYENSDLKNMYVTRQSLQSKLKAPIMTQEQLLLMRASKCTIGDANNAGPMRSCSSNTFR
jgi:hypothetical protein